MNNQMKILVYNLIIKSIIKLCSENETQMMKRHKIKYNFPHQLLKIKAFLKYHGKKLNP